MSEDNKTIKAADVFAAISPDGIKPSAIDPPGLKPEDMCDPYNVERNKILSITPKDYDPLLYWHQVARDAQKCAERDRDKLRVADRERNEAKQDLNRFTDRLVGQAASNRNHIPLDLTRLVEMAVDGKITLGISLTITSGGCCLSDLDMKGERCGE